MKRKIEIHRVCFNRFNQPYGGLVFSPFSNASTMAIDTLSRRPSICRKWINYQWRSQLATVAL
jgi:hypothetical protein